VIAFAPYEPYQFERVEPAADISDAMWRYFQQKLTGDPYATARYQVRILIGEIRARIERALEQLQAQVMDDAAIDGLREAGELLLTYQGRVTRGSREITVPDHTGNPRTIMLNPTLTPVENAQAYFRRYRKATRATDEVSTRIAALTPDLAYLDQLMTDLTLAESRPEIDAVHCALVEAGWARRPRQSTQGQARGLRRLKLGGFTVYVGRNARQNEEVTFKHAAPDDLWPGRTRDHQDRRAGRAGGCDPAGGQVGGVSLSGARRGPRKRGCNRAALCAPAARWPSWARHLPERTHHLG
jgi:predicted ribosome quality control (RQC) complex YloA/Tae2 family protein